MFSFGKKCADFSDVELIQRYKKSGDIFYIGELFKRYTHFVYGVCIKYLKNEEESKDAVMEVFDHLRQALLDYEISNFKSWLFSVTRNHCFMIMRKNNKVPFVSSSAEELANIISFVENEVFLYPNDGSEQRFGKEEIYGAIDQLSEEQKVCIELFYLEGKRYQEIAKITQYTLKQVKSYIQNGRRNLKNILSRKEGK